MTVWFDTEDLFHYIRSGNKRISGIQRLTLEIYRAAHQIGGGAGSVRFVRHGDGGQVFTIVDWREIEAEFAAIPEPPAPAATGQVVVRPAERRSLARRKARELAALLPEDVRRPLVLASVMQVQSVAALGAFGVNLIRESARAALRATRRLAPATPRPQRHHAATPNHSTNDFTSLAQPGDTLLVLGSPWFREEYSAIARWLRDERRMRFGVLVHDLVPIRRPEWCHSGVTRTFTAWYSDVLPFCDIVLANSRHTARDVEAYARERGIVLPGPVQPVPVGTGFGFGALDSQPDEARPAGLPQPGSYVLFVSTMEARKNHALAVRIWRQLLDEVQAGTRPASSVPDLVFAGRIGWLVADLIQQLENTAWLGGRVRLVQDPSDSELRALYRGCLFTLFPSLYEGWGLPVTESLALGKPCVTSDAAALPEAGGALARYFDAEDGGSAYRAVSAWLDDRPALAAWQAQVERDFHPTPWSDTARTLLQAVEALDPPAA